MAAIAVELYWYILAFRPLRQSTNSGRFVVIVLLCAITFHSSALCQEGNKLPIQQAIVEIEQMPLNLSLLDELRDDEMWQSVIDNGRKRLIPALQASRGHEDAAMQLYVNSVFQNEPENSIRLLLVAEPYILQSSDGNSLEMARIMIGAAKAEVGMMQSPEGRAAIYRVYAWRGLFINRRFPTHVLMSSNLTDPGRENGHPAGEEVLWVRLRDFYVIAMATDREDLLDGISLENVQVRWQEWVLWFEKNRFAMRASTRGAFWHADNKATPNPSLTVSQNDFWFMPDIIERPIVPFRKWPTVGLPLPPIYGSPYAEIK